VILNSTILDPASVMDRSVVVGARHNRLAMPSGGAALFTAARDLQFAGSNGIAFRCVGDELRVAEGGRLTSLFLDDEVVPLVSNESIKSYNDAEYCQPILGNRLSFEEAGKRVGAIDPHSLEASWRAAWSKTRL
jgi:hypothetical protein